VLAKITFNDFEAKCIQRIDSVGNSSPIYLELLGSITATKAIWAALVSTTRERSGSVNIDDTWISFDKNSHYRKFEKRVEKMLHVAIMHTGLCGTSQSPPLYLLHTADEMPPTFYGRLIASVKLPFRPEWGNFLWKIGQEPIKAMFPHQHQDYRTKKTETTWQESEITLIKPLTSKGTLFGWQISENEHGWLAAVKAASRKHTGLAP
jgi:hypothetical protein